MTTPTLRVTVLLVYVAALHCRVHCHLTTSPAEQQTIYWDMVKMKGRSIANVLRSIENGRPLKEVTQRASTHQEEEEEESMSSRDVIGYAEWTQWSQCSRKCRQRRFRRCSSGSPPGCKAKKETRQCTGHRCTAPGNVPEDRRSSNRTASATKNFKVLYHLQPFVYAPWSEWTPCTKNCRTRRYRPCVMPLICGKTVLQEDALCYAEGSSCEILYKPKLDADELDPAVDESSNKDPTEGPKFECGIAPAHPGLRIIGGQATWKGKWPWQVALLNRNREPFCGGTLVAPGWVLTAAHCIRRRLYIVAGEHNLKKRRTREIRVLESHIHPEYDVETVDNDVALLRLATPVAFDESIGAACLPDKPLPVGSLGTILGWGKLNDRAVNGSDILQEAQVPVTPQEDCRQVYAEYFVSENMMCAGYKRGRIDSCAGDSGGPLLVQDKQTKRWTVHGITSFGEGCGQRFGIYARVVNYVSWIKATMATL